MKAQLLLDTKCTLAEGPIWDARAQALFFTDIYESVLYRHDPARRELKTFAMPERDLPR